MKLKLTAIAFLAVFSLCLVSSCVHPTPPKFCVIFDVDKVYGDQMVLQRDRDIVIRGSGEPDHLVQVSIQKDDYKDSGIFVVNGDGRWEARLAPLSAGGPYTVRVAGNSQFDPIVFKDVLIGEVWICSGQSNMEMPIYTGNPRWGDERYEEIRAEAANYPQIRIFNEAPLKYVSPMELQTQPKGKWTVATYDTLPSFSATGYNFGLQLAKDLPGVPIGLVNVSWSGTRIEPWISELGYKSANRKTELDQITLVRMTEKERAKIMEKAIIDFNDKAMQWMNDFERTNPTPHLADDWHKADFDDTAWRNLESATSIFADQIDGVAWLRKIIDIPQTWVGKELLLNLDAIDDCDWTYVNGTLVGKTLINVPAYWSTKRIYTVPAEAVTSTKLVLAIRIADLFSEGGLPGTAKRVVSPKDAPDEAIDITHGWKFNMEFASNISKLGGQPIMPNTLTLDTSSPQFPTTLYNSLINPWTHYPVRGAIWYQGCSNAGNPADYFILQQLLVSDWRRAWNDPDFAFIITQLAGFLSGGASNPPNPDDWKKFTPNSSAGFTPLREAQFFAMKAIPRCGIAVTIDHGDQFDIHPHNKTIVGFRLAKEAERICYGNDGITRGPEFKEMTIDGAKIVLHFDNVGGGLVAKDSQNGKLNEFFIAGKDFNFIPAEAVIQGDTVVVSSPEVSAPVAVRYAWLPYMPDINFYNAEGFPACPFRTDTPAWANP